MTSDLRTPSPALSCPVDLAPFALARGWSGSQGLDLEPHDLQPGGDGCYTPFRSASAAEWHLGLEWQEPEPIERVSVVFAPGETVPEDLRVEYWRQNWPTIAPERRAGARRGWIGCDDPWHGSWTTVRAEQRSEGDTCTFLFDPVDLAEIPDPRQLAEAEDYLVTFRRTLKLRVVGGGEPIPRIQRIRACSPALWQQMDVDVRFQQGGDWGGQAEVYRGHLLGVEPQVAGVRLRLLYAASEVPGAARTIVTLRTAARSFSFLVTDLLQGPIDIRDYGVRIALAGPGADGERRPAARPIYERVAGEPEQSLARARAEIPPLDVTKVDSHGANFGLYVVLGVEGGRQEFGLRYNGELFIGKTLLKPRGRDLARLIWPGTEIHYRFGTGDPPDFRLGRDATRRSRLDGYLPIFGTEWLDRELVWSETAFAAPLAGPMTPPEARRGDEDLVALLRFSVRNPTEGRKQACLWLAVEPAEQLDLREGLGGSRTAPTVMGAGGSRTASTVMGAGGSRTAPTDGDAGCVRRYLAVAVGRAVPDLPVGRQWRVDAYRRPCLRWAAQVQRGRLRAIPCAEGGGAQAIDNAILYQVELEPGERADLDLAIPFASLEAGDERAAAAAGRFDAALADVAAYWRAQVAAGGQIDLPEPLLNDFHRASRIHTAITADKDPTSGLMVLPVATFSYPACGNEACWQITMLDQAGHHDRAETYLETFLRTQGAFRLDGRFSSAQGALQGLDLDDGRPVQASFVYNLDQGVIMECLANHYRLSGDGAWLERVTPHLLAACGLISRERRSTMELEAGDCRSAAWGLLPAGHLEDNPEWRHWFAVNAHAYAGFKASADVLAGVGHPEAAGLQGEAAAYREDIRAAARRALVEAPVVRLLDGSYIPHLPPRTGIRGRERGWFREAAYGALHLLEGGVFEPWEEEMTWVLQDLEDNLFISREWGRPVDLERYWFSHGGVTIQPNLMDIGIDYLRRGQVEHGLRALFNNIASSLFPDLRVFVEHPVVELGHGVGPFYKTSDEAKALIWLRAFLLLEEGETLHLAPGAPRAWLAAGQRFAVRGMASAFGPLSYGLEAHGERVCVRIEPPVRRPPRQILLHLRLPRPARLCEVTVNGRPHDDFDAEREIVRLAAPTAALQVCAWVESGQD